MKKAAWMLTALLLTGCAGAPKPLSQQPPGDLLQATVFRCPDGFQFGVRWWADGARADVLLSNATAFLQRDVSGSGARYTASQIALWNKGDEATLTLYGRAYRGCREDRRQSTTLDARYRGVMFRAAGNEPPWVFEMGREMMVVVTGYARNVAAFPLARPPRAPDQQMPAPDIRENAVAGQNRITVRASAAGCRDDMSGAASPYRVHIAFNDQTLRGCGGWLPQAPE